MSSSHRSEFADEPKPERDLRNPYAAPHDTGEPSRLGPSWTPDLTGNGTDFDPPTGVRYEVLTFAVSMSVLLYLHRFALSVAMPPIKQELGLTDTQLGLATGVFFYVYALAQVPSGWLSDYFGARITLCVYMVLWSLALGATGFIGGLGTLIVCRGLLGLAQAGAYPCIASVNKRWFPVNRRGVANSSTTTGGRAGSMLATALTPVLMGVAGTTLGVATGQWRYVFMLYAFLGFLWALLFFRRFRETPDRHPACNAAERALILGHSPPSNAGLPADSPSPGTDAASRSSHPALPLPIAMLVSPTMWLLCGISVFVNVGWIFLVTFLPTYLNRVHDLPLKTVGVLAALPVLAGMCGGMLGGIGTDLLVRRVGLVWGRRIPGLVATVGAGLGYLTCLQIDNPYLLVVLFAMVGLLIDFGLGSLWAVYQDIAGRQVAAVLGFANMCGNLAAGFFPLVIGFWAGKDRWDLVFIGSASALFITASCWAFVNPQQKLAAD